VSCLKKLMEKLKGGNNKMKNRSLTNLICIIALCVLVLTFGGKIGSASQPEIVLDVAIHPLEFYQQSVRAFIDHVESNSGGRIKVRTYTFPELGSDAEVIEMVSVGEIDMGTALADGAFATMMPSSQVISLPFLISNPAVFAELMRGPFFYKLQEKFLEESNGTIRPLGFMMSSIRHLYSTKGPIRTPADLKKYGIKLRVMTAPYYVALWGGLGVSSTIGLPAAERYQALQTGIIDACEGSLMSAWQAGLMEVNKYATLTAHTFGYAGYIINEDTFQSLPIDLQNILIDGTRQAVMVDNGYLPLSNVEALENMKNVGIEIIVPTEDELEKWREVAFPIGRQFLEEKIDASLLEQLISEVKRIEAEFASERDMIAGRK